VGRLGAFFALVVANLQQPLLTDVGIKCSGSGGNSGGAAQQQLHRCRELAQRQFAGWAGGKAGASPGMTDLLEHVVLVEVSGSDTSSLQGMFLFLSIGLFMVEGYWQFAAGSTAQGSHRRSCKHAACSSQPAW
jgi:hypothetical protein